MNPILSSILSKATRFFSGTALSRLSGFVRDLSMAYAFGAQSSVAALMVAFRLANLLRRLLGEGAMQSAFTPQFEKLKTLPTNEAYPFFYDLKCSLSLFLLFLTAIGSLLLGSSLFLEGWSDGNLEIIHLTLLLCPSLLFICLYGINSSFLQCEGFYFIPACAPICFNLIWTLFALTLSHLPVKEAMQRLAIGIDFACFFQWLITVPFVWRALRIHLPTLRPQILSEKIRLFIAPLSLGLIGVGAVQINSAIDALFARYADPSGPAYLWYAIRVQQVPLSLFGVAISGAILPSLSRLFASNEKEKYFETIKTAKEISNFLLWPATLFLIAFAPYCISALYFHGDFQAFDVFSTATALAAYSLAILPAANVIILAPAFYAQHNYKTPLKASLISVAINISLNYFFIFHLGLGATSIALATAGSALVNSLYLRKKLGRSSMQWKTPLQATFALGFTLGIERLLTGNNIFLSYFLQNPILKDSQWGILLLLFGSFCCLYLGLKMLERPNLFSLYSARSAPQCGSPPQKLDS